VRTLRLVPRLSVVATRDLAPPVHLPPDLRGAVMAATLNPTTMSSWSLSRTRSSSRPRGKLWIWAGRG